MMLDYMDDRTAIVLLATCQSLHAVYHHYPLKRPMTEWAFRDATQLEKYYYQRNTIPIYATLLFIAVIALVVIVLTTKSPWYENAAPTVVFGVPVVALSCYTAWFVYRLRRTDCCTRGRRGMWRRRYVVPRVVRLTTALRDVRFLPYLQHLTELTIAYDKYAPFSQKYPLPQSVRTLRLNASPELELKPDMLPPRLTSLSLSKIKNTPLLPGVLPTSLTSLHLTADFDTRWAIGAGVLLASLQRLEVDEWKLPLSRITMPPSLTELDIHSLSNHRLPVLPPQLQLFAIGGAFNQPLTGVLPSSLRILRLAGHFSQPLTAIEFASTPVLEELHLGDRSALQLAASVLPRSLRVLQLGKRCSLVMAEASEVPPQLRRLILSSGWDAERVMRLQQFSERHGFTVEVETEAA